MYAVVTTGGKQIRVSQGDLVRVEKLPGEVGETVELGASFVAKDDGVLVDPDALKSAKVTCEITGHGKRKKIRVFKKKRRKNYMRTHGHRQQYTELRVREISA